MGASEAKRDVLFSIRPFYVDKILEGPCFPALSDVGTILFAGAHGFF
jgi:hypothetical protein